MSGLKGLIFGYLGSSGSSFRLLGQGLLNCGVFEV